MKVHELTAVGLDSMYKVVKADQVGCISRPEVIYEAGRVAVDQRYGDCELVHFTGAGKNKVMIWIR